MPGVSPPLPLSVCPVLVAGLLGQVQAVCRAQGGVQVPGLLPGRRCRLLPAHQTRAGPQVSPPEDHQPQGLAEALQTKRPPRGPGSRQD